VAGAGAKEEERRICLGCILGDEELNVNRPKDLR
jgi:hypothetical protein